MLLETISLKVKYLEKPQENIQEDMPLRLTLLEVILQAFVYNIFS